MLTIDDIAREVDTAREEGRISEKNYWIYVSMSGSACRVSMEEKPSKGYIGFFCEDDSRLSGIYTIAERKVKRNKIQ